MVLFRSREAANALGILAVLLALALPSQAQPSEVATMLIDDFRNEDGRAAIGSSWRIFTDQVMGGVSVARGAIAEVDGERCLRLVGRVSLANNGGFVQAALDLSTGTASLDASEYRGLRLRVQGSPGAYYVHLRTDDCRLPWQYYGAELRVTEEWTEVQIPFSRFEPSALGRSLDASRLQRIGIVAAKKEFDADVSVSRLELVR